MPETVDLEAEARDKTSRWQDTLNADQRALLFFLERVSADEKALTAKVATHDEAKRRNPDDENLVGDLERIANTRAIIAGFKDAARGCEARAIVKAADAAKAARVLDGPKVDPAKPAKP